MHTHRDTRLWQSHIRIIAYEYIWIVAYEYIWIVSYAYIWIVSYEWIVSRTWVCICIHMWLSIWIHMGLSIYGTINMYSYGTINMYPYGTINMYSYGSTCQRLVSLWVWMSVGDTIHSYESIHMYAYETIHMYSYAFICDNPYVFICDYSYETCQRRVFTWVWVRVGDKLATNYRALLRKMTYTDKASYDSTPPCSAQYECDCTTHECEFTKHDCSSRKRAYCFSWHHCNLACSSFILRRWVIQGGEDP